jgi:hypothetical protein
VSGSGLLGVLTIAAFAVGFAVVFVVLFGRWR